MRKNLTFLLFVVLMALVPMSANAQKSPKPAANNIVAKKVVTKTKTEVRKMTRAAIRRAKAKKAQAARLKAAAKAAKIVKAKAAKAKAAQARTAAASKQTRVRPTVIVVDESIDRITVSSQRVVVNYKKATYTPATSKRKIAFGGNALHNDGKYQTLSGKYANRMIARRVRPTQPTRQTLVSQRKISKPERKETKLGIVTRKETKKYRIVTTTSPKLRDPADKEDLSIAQTGEKPKLKRYRIIIETPAMRELRQLREDLAANKHIRQRLDDHGTRLEAEIRAKERAINERR